MKLFLWSQQLTARLTQGRPANLLDEPQLEDGLRQGRVGRGGRRVVPAEVAAQCHLIRLRGRG